jgi:hypothetical protein
MIGVALNAVKDKELKEKIEKIMAKSVLLKGQCPERKLFNFF